jgi:hypothetical protein
MTCRKPRSVGEGGGLLRASIERRLSARAPYPGYLAPETESLARSRGVDALQKESFNVGPERASVGMTDPEALGFCFAPTL